MGHGIVSGAQEQIQKSSRTQERFSCRELAANSTSDTSCWSARRPHGHSCVWLRCSEPQFSLNLVAGEADRFVENGCVILRRFMIPRGGDGLPTQTPGLCPKCPPWQRLYSF